jgi:hypothetical protein
LVRTFRHAMEDHPFIVASKVPLDRSESVTGARSAHIDVAVGAPLPDGGGLPARVTLTNRGSMTWAAASRSGTGHVSLGVQLLAGDGRLINRDFHRVALPHDMMPGMTATLSFTCPTPASQDSYTLKFDLVAEGVTWFEAVGSPAATTRVTIASRSADA